MAIVHDSIQSQLYDEIKQDILRRKYHMGDQLNARQLAEKYGVSVMPVRDALLQLTKKGLVVNKARVGFFVTEYNETDIGDIMDVRKMHELYCMNKFFKQIDREELKRIHQCMLDQFEKDQKQFDYYDARFHNIIVEASSNRFLNTQYDNIKDLLTLSICYDEGHDKEACEEHQAILDAVVNNEKARAVKLLDAHLNRVSKNIADNMRIEGGRA